MTPALALVLGLGLLFAATLLVVLATGDLIRERRAVDRSLTAIRSMDAVPIDPRAVTAPFSERVIAPIGDQLINLGRLLTRQGAEERLQHRLDIAGNPRGWTVERIAGFKVLGMVVLAALGMVLVAARGGSFPVLVVIAIAFGTFGYLLPNLLLINAGQKREERMRNALPDALDLMTISVEAGLGFDAAMSRVAHDTKGPLAQEFSRVLQEMQLGVGRINAMRAMADRTTIKELKTFSLAMVQADSFGVPVARALRVQAKEMRVARRQRAEERAQKVPVKILFPLIFFILPALFIVILGPIVLNLIDVLGSM